MSRLDSTSAQRRRTRRSRCAPIRGTRWRSASSSTCSTTGWLVEQRDAILDALFEEFIGDERGLANELYLTATEAREDAGRRHGDGRTFARAHAACRRSTNPRSARPDHLRHAPQGRAVPARIVGRSRTRTDTSTRLPSNACARPDSTCSFALDGGDNRPRHDLFRVRRIDTKDLVF